MKTMAASGPDGILQPCQYVNRLVPDTEAGERVLRQHKEQWVIDG